MSYDIKIPAVGESVSTGFIAQWHKADGDTVAAGDLLITLETDKISTEITAEGGGVLSVLVAEGEEVPIGAVVGRIGEASASGDPGAEPAAGAGEASAAKPETAAKPEAGDGEEGAERQVPVSPAVRQLAEENGVDLDAVQGTGKKGAVLKSDVQALIDARPPAPAVPPRGEVSTGAAKPDLSQLPAALADPPAGAGQARPEDGGRVTRKKMSPLRRKIAAQLVSAQQNAALLTTFNECDMSAVMKLRKDVQEGFVAKHGVKLGFMSIFIKATVDALREVPGINARVEGDDIITNHYFDIGVAVGTERGLVVPVIRDCDQKSFAQIEKDIADYAGKAREGKLELSDLQGGVFTISNGGIYGSMLSTPILNPPQSGILGMHNIMQRPVAVDGEVVVRPMMYLALSYDHRIVDGQEAVTFLVRVKDCIENPMRLLVGA